MALLSKKDADFLRGHFADKLVAPVRLAYFTQTIPCQFCRETEQVLREVADLSDKVTLEVYNLITDKDKADALGIDKIPGTAVLGAKDYGVRFYGIASGYEFTSLVEDIVDVSRGQTNLSARTLELLAKLDQPVHIQVFVTPTCPYCTSAVRLAHSLAIASDMVRADMVESIEFPQLANKYQVKGVPRTVVNETSSFEGAAPEPLFVAKVLHGAGAMSDEEVQALMVELSKKGK
jgi:glutaredoxin-like protein